MKYLTLLDIELIHIQIIDESGGSQGVRDRGRIESAVAGQSQEVFGELLYKTVFEKAAAMAKGIIADHPFVDGNKRTGMMSALVFLELNSIDMSPLTDKQLEDFAVSIATDHLSIGQIATWLKSHSK